MSTFDLAIMPLLKDEGRYSNNLHDHGGPTNFGLSSKFLNSPENIDICKKILEITHVGPISALDIQKITIEKATQIYKLLFWDKYNISAINDQLIATKVFDLGVNLGFIQSVRILQRAVRASSGVLLTEDGLLGPITISSVNACNSQSLLSAIRSEAAGIYRIIVAINHNDQVFAHGWIDRAYE